MSEILSTDAIVLKKIDYGDTSKIVTFFTEKFGKIQGIIKGAKSPKSKIGKLADTLNLVNIVFYKKQNRDIQLISQIDLINDYKLIKSELYRLKYGSAIIEMFLKLIVDDDEHTKLFKGLIRILELTNTEGEQVNYLFAKFYLFFIKEIGYAPAFSNCSSCGKPLEKFNNGAFNFEIGIYCSECKIKNLTNFEMEKELLNLISCLSFKNNRSSCSDLIIDKFIFFIEKYMSYHIQEFTGLKSLQVY